MRLGCDSRLAAIFSFCPSACVRCRFLRLHEATKPLRDFFGVCLPPRARAAPAGFEPAKSWVQGHDANHCPIFSSTRGRALPSSARFRTNALRRLMGAGGRTFRKNARNCFPQVFGVNVFVVRFSQFYLILLLANPPASAPPDTFAPSTGRPGLSRICCPPRARAPPSGIKPVAARLLRQWLRVIRPQYFKT